MIAQELHRLPTEPAPIPSPAATPPPRRFRGFFAIAFAALVLSGSAAGAGAAALVNRTQTASTTSSVSSTSSASTSAASSTASTSVETLYKQAAAGVVTITTVVTGPFGRSGQGTGSGVVVDTKGDIVTNAHVVSGAQQIQVTFNDGQTAPATLVGIDSSADLAVLHVSVAASSLHPIALGNSDSVQVGDSVYAIGAPFGLSGSLTAGIISGLHRSNSASGAATGSNLIQTDAAINPGNSGGALLNAQGQLIGINESITSPVNGNVGVGFAIPSNQVGQLLPALERGLNQ